MCSPHESLTQWPDGRVVCAICVEPKQRTELARDEDGHLVDVCRSCAPLAWRQLDVGNSPGDPEPAVSS